MSDFLQVVTLVGERKAADAIAERLVEDRLAACGRLSGPSVAPIAGRGAWNDPRNGCA